MSGERILVSVTGSTLEELEALRTTVRERWPDAADVQVWQADRGVEQFELDFRSEGRDVEALRALVTDTRARLRRAPSVR